MSIIPFPTNTNISNLDKAQDIVYEAWDASTAKEKVKLAKKAIEISPLCADAFIILGNHSRSLKSAITHYRKAVEAGKLALKDDFSELEGNFWGVFETRSYMRSLAELAEALWEYSDKDESLEYYQLMLKLNPNDNQGVRYILASRFLATCQYEELKILLKQYEHDCDATWSYTELLLQFRESKKSPRLDKLLQDALRSNKHIPKYLINPKLIPPERSSYITMGGENQAFEYARENVGVWQGTGGAINFLKANLKK